MRLATWRLILGLGFVLAVICAPLGPTAQQVGEIVSFLSLSFAVYFGLRAHPANRSRSRSWILLAAAGVFYSAQHAVGLVAPTSPDAGVTVAEVLAILGSLCNIASLWSLASARDGGRDPHARLDSMIMGGSIAVVMLGLVVVPLLGNADVSPAAKFASALFDLIAALNLFAYIRLMMGPGTRNRSYWLASSLSLSVLGFDLLNGLTQASIDFPGRTVLGAVLATVGFAAGSAAVLDSTMSEASAPGVLGAHKAARRFLVTMASTIAPPAVLVIEPSRLDHYLILAWMFVLVPVGQRLRSLMLDRDYFAGVDAVVRTMANELTNAVTRDAMHDIALAAADNLASGADNDAVVYLMSVEFSTWKQLGSSRPTTAGLRGLSKTQIMLQELLGEELSAKVAPRVVRHGRVANRAVMYVPIVSRAELRGALLVVTNEALDDVLTDGCLALAMQLGLGLEAAENAENINRQMSDRRFRALVENSVDMIFVVTPDGQPSFASTTAEAVLRQAGELSDVFAVIDPADRSAFMTMVQNAPPPLQAAERNHSVECRVVTPNETERWIDARAVDMTHDTAVRGIVITAHDISDRKIVESDLRHRVLHDELTGIANRALLRERTDHALALRKAGDTKAALLYIGIDNVNMITDSLGHDAGEDLLKVVAFRLDTFVRGHDTAAHIDAETFAVLLQDVSSEGDIQGVAERLLALVKNPIDLDGRQVELQASIGVCIARPDYDSEILLRNTEVALQEARLVNNHIAFFSESMAVSAAERSDLRRELAYSIERNEMTVYYQPMVNLDTKFTAGFEALVRWIHPERGMVNPGQFIPLAEESGFIVDIGNWVIEQACRQLTHWRAMKPGLDLKMSVNVAPQQLASSDFVSRIGQIIADTGTEPSALVLELTESEHMNDPLTRQRLDQLHGLGVGIAADDFGGGFASSTALRELPFTMVKIDRSLIIGLNTNFQKASTQLKTVVELAHETGLIVVAEGIEDSRQRDLLTEMGCDRGQGYFFGRPVNAGEAEDFVINSLRVEQAPAPN